MAKKQTQGLHGRAFLEHDLVFAKVRGYPPWPSRILQAFMDTRFNVFFYGTHQSSVVKNVDLEPFNEVTKAKYLKVKYKHYQESLKELQETPEIYLNFWSNGKKGMGSTPCPPKNKLVEGAVSNFEKPSKRAKKDLSQTELEEEEEEKPTKAPRTEETLSDKKNPREKNTVKGKTEHISSDVLETSKKEQENISMDIDAIDPVNESKTDEKTPQNRKVSRRSLKKAASPIPEVSSEISKPKTVIEEKNVKNSTTEELANRENLENVSNTEVKSLKNEGVSRRSLNNGNPPKPDKFENHTKTEPSCTKLERDASVNDLQKPLVQDEKPDRKRRGGKSMEVCSVKTELVVEELPDVSAKQEATKGKILVKKVSTSFAEKIEVHADPEKGSTNGKDQPVDGKRKERDHVSSDKRHSKNIKLGMPTPVKDFLNTDKPMPLEFEILKKEYELISLESDLKKSLCVDSIDMIGALQVMKKLQTFQINKLEVLKNPCVEQTLRLLFDFYEDKKDSKNKKKVKLAKEIREMAQKVHEKIRKLFDMKDLEKFKVEYPKVVNNFETFSSELPGDMRLLTELPEKFH